MRAKIHLIVFIVVLFGRTYSQNTNEGIQRFFSLSDTVFHVGQIWDSGNILFDAGGGYYLHYCQQKRLDSIVLFLKKHSTITIGINVYNASSGGCAEQYITQKRADAIRSYLVDKGIHSERIISVGKGEYAGDDPYFMRFPIVVFYIFKL